MGEEACVGLDGVWWIVVWAERAGIFLYRALFPLLEDNMGIADGVSWRLSGGFLSGHGIPVFGPFNVVP